MRIVLPENLRKEFKRFCMYLSAISGMERIGLMYIQYDFDYMGIEWDEETNYSYVNGERIEIPPILDKYLSDLLENTISEETIYDNLPPNISDDFHERGTIDVSLYPEEFRMEIGIDYEYTKGETMTGGYDIDRVIGRIDPESIQEYIDNGDIFTVYFSGSGDRGDVEENGLVNNEYDPIPDPVQGLVYNTLDRYYSGWTEGPGSKGEMEVDFSNMTIDVEYTEYDTAYEYIKYGEITM
jgi:hypothetical protein